jgi:hypothetical protein
VTPLVAGMFSRIIANEKAELAAKAAAIVRVRALLQRLLKSKKPSAGGVTATAGRAADEAAADQDVASDYGDVVVVEAAIYPAAKGGRSGLKALFSRKTLLAKPAASGAVLGSAAPAVVEEEEEEGAVKGKKLKGAMQRFLAKVAIPTPSAKKPSTTHETVKKATAKLTKRIKQAAKQFVECSGASPAMAVVM